MGEGWGEGDKTIDTAIYTPSPLSVMKISYNSRGDAHG